MFFSVSQTFLGVGQSVFGEGQKVLKAIFKQVRFFVVV